MQSIKLHQCAKNWSFPLCLTGTKRVVKLDKGGGGLIRRGWGNNDFVKDLKGEHCVRWNE